MNGDRVAGRATLFKNFKFEHHLETDPSSSNFRPQTLGSVDYSQVELFADRNVVGSYYFNQLSSFIQNKKESDLPQE